MTQNVKEEALEQLRNDVLMGFDVKEQIIENITEMFYDEEDFDEDWLQQEVAVAFDAHQAESRHWQRPTDVDRLIGVFDALIAQRIVCLHKAGYTKQDGEGDCAEVVEALKEKGIAAKGYCFYHTQDTERAIDPDMRNLFLSFDSVSGGDTEALAVAQTIVATLKAAHFEIVWNGSVGMRIEICNLTWRNAPREEDLGMFRNIWLMSSANEV